MVEVTVERRHYATPRPMLAKLWALLEGQFRDRGASLEFRQSRICLLHFEFVKQGQRLWESHVCFADGC